MILTGYLSELYELAPLMKKLIVIAGPTCTGKSEIAVALAKKLKGEVVSADSVQVYRGMDIGSAKITKDKMQGIRHHLIDVIDINTDYNVFMFQKMAKKALSEIYARESLPIICGGTGFYIQSLIYDIDFEEDLKNSSIDLTINDKINSQGKNVRLPINLHASACRKDEFKILENPKQDIKGKLEKILKEKGLSKLVNLLASLDSYAYEGIDLKNSKKVIRAIEFYLLYGYSIRKHNEIQKLKREFPTYDVKFFVLYLDRKLLYERIDERVDLMMHEGLLDEVKKLMEKGLSLDKTAGQAIGYKELIMALSGSITLKEAIKNIKINTRHFAKRQITWFKREKKAHWIDVLRTDVLDEIGKYL